jgi:hypothetical protein
MVYHALSLREKEFVRMVYPALSLRERGWVRGFGCGSAGL